MNAACLETSGAMAAVIGLEAGQLEEFLKRRAQEHGDTVCVANFIFPKGVVISGSEDAVKWVKEQAKEAGAIVKEVAVSGAFHSPLMSSAVPKLQSFLSTVDISLPRISVYSNITGRPYTCADEIRVLLAEQVTKPVLWEDGIRSMIRDNPSAQFVEVGPGRQLKAMLRRTDREKHQQCTNIEV